jgi:steroid delta-isomerase-like uncharacterized protein
MSEANKSLCKRFIEEVWNNRKTSAIDELVAANYTPHVTSGPDFGRGPESVRKTIGYYTAAFPDTHFTIDDVIAEGDRVVARWTVRATHRGEFEGIAPTGKSVTVTGTTVMRIENGKLAEGWQNFDALGLMQQIGAVQRQAAQRARGA